MTAIADSFVREDVLIYAKMITTDTADAVAVAVSASPLLAWIEEAATDSDLKDRHRALRRHHAGMLGAHLAPSDDPRPLLAGAKVLYAFITAGRDAP